MNNLASTPSFPFTWLGHFRLMRPVAATEAASCPDPQRLHLAFHRAYGIFAQTHPPWISRRFDADLLRPALVDLCGDDLLQINVLPTQRLAIQLALCWDAQFGCLYTTETRIRQIEELKAVSAQFLRLFQQERSNGARWRGLV